MFMNRFTRWSFCPAATIALFTLFTRLPFRSTHLFAWDSANFALALENYNVSWHQPQPPGYILYVAAARLLHFFVHDANAAYVWLSIMASVGAVWCTVLLGNRIFGSPTGSLGGLLLSTSSLFWGQGEVAYPYTFLAFFSSLVMLSSIENRYGRRDTTIIGAVLLALAGGFRPELVPFLLPLWLWGSWGKSPWRLLTSSLLLIAIILGWYVPMVLLSGGWQIYESASGNYFIYYLNKTSGFGKLLLGVLENTRTLVEYTYNGIGLALIPVLSIGGRFFSPPRLVTSMKSQALGLWIGPPLCFYLFIHIGNPGYLLSFLPAVCLIAAHGTLAFTLDIAQARQAHRNKNPFGRPQEGCKRSGAEQMTTRNPRWVSWATVAIVALIATSNAALFLTASGEGRLPEIQAIDRILGKQVTVIRDQFPSESSIILSYDRSRQFSYYLPNHRIELLFAEPVVGIGYDAARYWEKRRLLTVPPGVKYILLPDLGENTSERPGPVDKLDLGAGVGLLFAGVSEGAQVHYGYRYFSVTPAIGSQDSLDR